MTAIAKYGPPFLSNLPFVYQGKTRDTFEGCWPNPNDKRRPPLLIVATDRLSTHNIVHTLPVGKKGEVLTALTIFWLIDVLEKAGVAHHLVAYGKRIYDYLPGRRSDYPKDLHYRAIVVKHLDIIMVEFIFRAYLCGSLWDKFYSKGLENPYGVNLPQGLPLMHKFDQSIFTPTVKSDTDPELVSAEVEEQYPAAVSLTRRVFEIGRARLHQVGLGGLDTKEEAGIDEDGQVVIADEVLTPDSSRFARLADIREGENPPWLDKQVARDAAEKVWKEQGSGVRGPVAFPPLVCARLFQVYQDIVPMVVGQSLYEFQSERLD